MTMLKCTARGLRSRSELTDEELGLSKHGSDWTFTQIKNRFLSPGEPYLFFFSKRFLWFFQFQKPQCRKTKNLASSLSTIKSGKVQTFELKIGTGCLSEDGRSKPSRLVLRLFEARCSGAACTNNNYDDKDFMVDSSSGGCLLLLPCTLAPSIFLSLPLSW